MYKNKVVGTGKKQTLVRVKDSFDEKIIKERHKNGDIEYALTKSGNIILFGSIQKEWRVLYNGKYNDNILERWKKIKEM